jgi:hypothetical protein
MAILKYSYLSLGIVLYIIFNVLSYTHPSYAGPLEMKIIFSIISLGLLIFDYLAILFTRRFFKRDFSDFTTYIKVTLYLGIIITPMISLYY